MTGLVSRIQVARELAASVHALQVDKAGKRYIDHPKRVAQRLTEFDTQLAIPGIEILTPSQLEVCVIAGWLHDVLEDSGTADYSPVLPADIQELFGREVTKVVQKLSRGEWFDMDEFVNAAIATDPLAKLVKLSDIADNTNHARVQLMIQAGGSVKPGKYEHALKVLGYTPEQLAWLVKDQTRIY